MRRHRTVFAGLVIVALALGVGLRSEPGSKVRAAPTAAPAERTVHIIGGDVAETDLTAISAALAGGKHPGVLPVDSPRAESPRKPSFARLRPGRIAPLR